MSKMSKKKIIGITGSMGSGKSQVSKILQKYYPVLDCDQVNAELLLPGKEGFKELKKRNLISLDETGNINKLALSKSMFENPKIKQEVESILHPLIFKKMHEWINEQVSELVFIEMPLLFEINAKNQFDKVWCIVVDDKIALDRLEKYRHISNEEAKRRLAHQMSVKEKISQSDVVIYNNHDLKTLEDKVQNQVEKEKSWS